MMKKTTSALAIAALLGTGAASAATFQINDTTTVGIGGVFYPTYTDTKDGNGNSTDSYGDFNRLTFTAEKAAANGMTASVYYQIRPQGGLGGFADGDNVVDGDDESDAGVRTHVGYATLSGEFGSATYGKNDNLMYRYIDVLRDPYLSRFLTFSNASERTRVLTYASPDFDGFGFEVESELAGDGETIKEETGNSSSFNAAAYADLDPITLHAVYASGDLNPGSEGNSDGAYGVAAVTSIDIVNLSVAYTKSQIEEYDATEAGNTSGVSTGDRKDQNIASIMASAPYGYGNLQLSAQEVDVDGQSNRTEVIAGVTYDIADNVYTSLEYSSYDKENDEGNGFGVALWYAF